MTDEKIFPNPMHPAPGAEPGNLIEMPANNPPRVKRRVRSLTPPDAAGFATTSHLNASEPACLYRELLDAANDNFRPKNAYAAALSAQNARALWGMRRVDESMSLAVDLETDFSWTAVEEEFEDLDHRCRALIATAHLAERPLSRFQLGQANYQLRSLALTSRLLASKAKT